MEKGNQDSEIVHKETFDLEDELFAALDEVLGSNNVETEDES